MSTFPRLSLPVAAGMNPEQPLQQQIFVELRGELLDGLWVNRKDFYTEKELAERFGVSVITSRAVLDRLAQEGWISRARGRRSTPLAQPLPLSEDNDDPVVIIGDKGAFDYQVHFAGVRVAPWEACEAFGLPAGSSLWQCFRLRSHAGVIHSVTHNAQLPALGVRHSHHDLATRSMIKMLDDIGERPALLRRRVSAVLAPQLIASLLGVAMGSTILCYTCAISRKDSSAIEWLRVFMHPSCNPSQELFDLAKGRWLKLGRP